MKKILFFFAITLLVSCKSEGDSPAPAPTVQETLVANNWRLTRLVSLSGEVIAENRLNASTKALYDLDFQFTDRFVTRAMDKVSKQVVNSGTWSLKENDKVLNVNVIGFRGDFGVNFPKPRMTLKNRVPVSGQDQDVLMEFEPAP
jgi:hypothetical protein